MSGAFQWSFSLRQDNAYGTGYDSDDGDDAEEPTAKAFTDSDIDLASRDDAATFRPNPWLIAKLNAASRKDKDDQPVEGIASPAASPVSSPVKPKNRVSIAQSRLTPAKLLGVTSTRKATQGKVQSNIQLHMKPVTTTQKASTVKPPRTPRSEAGARRIQKLHTHVSTPF